MEFHLHCAMLPRFFSAWLAIAQKTVDNCEGFVITCTHPTCRAIQVKLSNNCTRRESDPPPPSVFWPRGASPPAPPCCPSCHPPSLIPSSVRATGVTAQCSGTRIFDRALATCCRNRQKTRAPSPTSNKRRLAPGYLAMLSDTSNAEGYRAMPRLPRAHCDDQRGILRSVGFGTRVARTRV